MTDETSVREARLRERCVEMVNDRQCNGFRSDHGPLAMYSHTFVSDKDLAAKLCTCALKGDPYKTPEQHGYGCAWRERRLVEDTPAAKPLDASALDSCPHTHIARVPGQQRAWCQDCKRMFIDASDMLQLAEKLAAAQREIERLREQIETDTDHAEERIKLYAEIAAAQRELAQWKDEVQKQSAFAGECNHERLEEKRQRVEAGFKAATPGERYAKLIDGLVDMQRHRDAWRNYAYVGAVVPDDYLDGNKVDRLPTRIEALEAALACLATDADTYMKYHAEKFYADAEPKPTGLWPAIERARALLPAKPHFRNCRPDESCRTNECQCWCHDAVARAALAGLPTGKG